MNHSTTEIDDPATAVSEPGPPTESADALLEDEVEAPGARPNTPSDPRPGVDANPLVAPNPLDIEADMPASNVVDINSAVGPRGKARGRTKGAASQDMVAPRPTREERARRRMGQLRSEPVVRRAGSREAAPASTMMEVAQTVALRHVPRSDAGVHVSVREMRSGDGGEILVALDDVAAVIDELGREAVAAGLVDVQIALAWKPRDGLHDVHSGFVLDIDVEVPDVEALIAASGMVPPTLVWRSPRGVKLGWLFTEPVSRLHFDAVAQAMTVAFEGADASSLRPTQHQRLPFVNREDDGGNIRELREPVYAYGPRLDAELFIPTLPRSLARILLADDAPDCVDVASVVAYLAELKITLPESGHVVLRRCPLGEHDAKKCYAHPVDHAGPVLYCHGNHDGAGPQTWTLSRLAKEAVTAGFGGRAPRSTPAAASSRVSSLIKVPLTWVAFEYVKFHLGRSLSGHLLAAAERVALRALVAAHMGYAKALTAIPASLQSDALAALEKVVAQLRQQNAACTARNGVPPIMPAWDETAQRLVSVTQTYALQSGLEKCPKKEIETLVLRAVRTTAYITVETGDDGSKSLSAGLASVAEAKENLFRIAWSTEAALRRILGVPPIRFEAYPVAFCVSGFACSSDASLTYTRVPDAHGECIDDPVDFIVRIFNEGKTPFATENDARLFAVVMAAPLLRELMQGRLPCAILTGPSGSGKNLIAECITTAWGASGSTAAPDLPYLTAESASANEFRLTVANMGMRIILRLPEVAKTGVAQEVVVKSERHTLFGRAHHGDPIEVPHRFLFIGDTLEGLPVKFEYERRIVQVRLIKNPDLNPADLIDTFREHGPALIEGFRRIVEARGRDFFRKRKSSDGRSPLAHALAELCGAVLSEVRGAELSELWDAIFDLVRGQRVSERGFDPYALQLLPGALRPKDGLIPGMFGTYSLDELCEKAKALPEHAETFRRINPNTIRAQLRAEKAPHFETVHLGKSSVTVLFVLARDTWGAFGLARNAKRFFFVDPELVVDSLKRQGVAVDEFEAAWERAKIRARNPEEDLAAEGVEHVHQRGMFIDRLRAAQLAGPVDDASRRELEGLATAMGLSPADVEECDRAALALGPIATPSDTDAALEYFSGVVS